MFWVTSLFFLSQGSLKLMLAHLFEQCFLFLAKNEGPGNFPTSKCLLRMFSSQTGLSEAPADLCPTLHLEPKLRDLSWVTCGLQFH